MEIDAEDTPATVRLKMRIRDLEIENYVLRNERGVFDRLPFASVSDLDLTPVSDLATELRLMATWDAKRDPVTGKLHVLGATHTPTAFKLSYFCEDVPHATRAYQERILIEMHKRMIRELIAVT